MNNRAKITLTLSILGLGILSFGFVTLRELEPNTIEMQSIMGFLSPAMNSFEELKTSTVVNFDYPEIVSENESFAISASQFFTEVGPDGTAVVRANLDERNIDTSVAVLPPEITNCVLAYTASAYSPGLEIFPNEPVRRIQDEYPIESWRWVAQANQPGTQLLLVNIIYEADCTDKTEPIYIDTIEYSGDIEVKNWFGLSLKQSKVLGLFATFSGSIMTLPGLLNFISSLNEKQKSNRRQNSKKKSRRR